MHALEAQLRALPAFHSLGQVCYLVITPMRRRHSCAPCRPSTRSGRWLPTNPSPDPDPSPNPSPNPNQVVRVDPQIMLVLNTNPTPTPTTITTR